MNDKPLQGKHIAILIANGFNEIDMTEGSRALIKAGATLKNIGVESGLINSWKGKGWGLNFMVDSNVNTILAADFDMLFVPSGERSITKLLESPHTKRIMRGFMDAHKPVSLQGDAIKILAFAERAEGYNICGDEAYKELLENAGALWNSGVSTLIDTHIITGIGNTSNSEFTKKMVALFCGLENDENLMQDAA